VRLSIIRSRKWGHSMDWLNRMVRAAKLDASFFKQVGQDPSKDGEALVVVAIASVLGGVVNGILITSSRLGWQLNLSIASMAPEFIIGILSCYAVAYLVFRIGTELFGARTRFDAVRRSLAYANAPGLLGVIPCLGVIGVPWSAVAYFVADHEILGLSNDRTALTLGLSWVVWFAFLSSVALLGLATARIVAGGN